MTRSPLRTTLSRKNRISNLFFGVWLVAYRLSHSCNGTFNPAQIGQNPRFEIALAWSGGAHHVTHGLSLQVTGFENEQAFFPKHPEGLSEDGAKSLKSILAAIERKTRIVGSHFSLKLSYLGRADIGRITYNYVERCIA